MKLEDKTIGDRFVVGDRTLEIIESEGGNCENCFIKQLNVDCSELQIYDLIPLCSKTQRKDKKEVEFREVGND